MLAALKLNAVFRAKHIAGKHNVIVDQLFRFQFEKARSVAPWLCQGQTVIPGSPPLFATLNITISSMHL